MVRAPAARHHIRHLLVGVGIELAQLVAQRADRAVHHHAPDGRDHRAVLHAHIIKHRACIKPALVAAVEPDFFHSIGEAMRFFFAGEHFGDRHAHAIQGWRTG